MNEVHIALQGKGGIGKSLICRFLLEHLDGVGIDADPENRTLAECKSLEVRQRDLLDGRGSIDPFAIDSLVEDVLLETSDVVVDIGAASYVEVSSYWQEHELVDLFPQEGKQLWLHFVVVGGPSLGASMRGIADQAALSIESNVNVCIWENEYFGPVVIDGVPFSQTGVVDKHWGHIVLKQRGRLFVAALEKMINEGHSFADAIESSNSVLARTRLQRLRDDIWEQLALVFKRDEKKDGELYESTN